MDSLDSFSVIDRQMNLRHLIKTREPTELSQKLSSVAGQSSSILFTRQNTIGFLKVSDGSVGSTFCFAGHDSILISAQVDYTSSGYVYGLSASS